MMKLKLLFFRFIRWQITDCNNDCTSRLHKQIGTIALCGEYTCRGKQLVHSKSRGNPHGGMVVSWFPKKLVCVKRGEDMNSEIVATGIENFETIPIVKFWF